MPVPRGLIRALLKDVGLDPYDTAGVRMELTSTFVVGTADVYRRNGDGEDLVLEQIDFKSMIDDVR